jgi:hypothetical protein
MEKRYRKSMRVCDLFSISQEFCEIGGLSLLNKYGSLSLLLADFYPQWEVKKQWNFEDMQNQFQFIEWAGKKLGVMKTSDWYKVTQKVRIL